MHSDSNACPTTILVVEDEADLRASIVDYLSLAGYHCEGVGSATAMKSWIQHRHCTIVILDLGLPDGDGFSLLEEISRRYAVICVTARGALDDRLRGMEEGADYYLTKPVELRELLAVVRRLEQRLHRESHSGAWRLSLVEWAITSPRGFVAQLTHTERLLIMSLADHAGQAVSRERLVEALGQNPAAYDYRRLETLVRRLRRKIKDCCGDPLPLETVHNVGYALTTAVVIHKRP
jgi:DNA-binding response OmpR family regulator